MKQCQNCIYAHFKSDRRDIIDCRRHTPRLAQGTAQLTAWPTCQATDWCGEWSGDASAASVVPFNKQGAA